MKINERKKSLSNLTMSTGTQTTLVLYQSRTLIEKGELQKCGRVEVGHIQLVVQRETKKERGLDWMKRKNQDN